MNIEAVLRAARILRGEPAYTMPLSTLHERLRKELGAEAGTYAQIYLQLKNLPQSFLMIDAPQLLHGTEVWPAQVREEYNSALGGVGLGACVRVALTEALAEEAHPGAVGLASKTVSELWAAAENDGVLLEYLSRAAHQLEEISSLLAADAEAARTTTPPPDPP
jgi:hypothetical protein